MKVCRTLFDIYVVINGPTDGPTDGSYTVNIVSFIILSATIGSSGQDCLLSTGGGRIELKNFFHRN